MEPWATLATSIITIVVGLLAISKWIKENFFKNKHLMKKDFYFPLLWATFDNDENLIDTNCLSELAKIQKDVVDNAEVIPYDYSKKMKLPELECKRCGGKWIPRSKKKPVQCPKCKSPYWNRKRERY